MHKYVIVNLAETEPIVSFKNGLTKEQIIEIFEHHADMANIDHDLIQTFEDIENEFPVKIVEVTK